MAELAINGKPAWKTDGIDATGYIGLQLGSNARRPIRIPQYQAHGTQVTFAVRCRERPPWRSVHGVTASHLAQNRPFASRAFRRQMPSSILLNPLPDEESVRHGAYADFVKPDCVQRRLVGRILSRFEDRAQRRGDEAHAHHARLGQAALRRACARSVSDAWKCSSPAVRSTPWCSKACSDSRSSRMSATSGLKAAAGTIRGDFSSAAK